MTRAIKRKRYYDYKTKNTSFIKVAGELKAQGVKNYMFHLEVKDPTLIGVDPYDPNLSIEMKTRIYREVKINFWYFIRECIRIPVPGKNVMYDLHRGNLAMSFCMLYNLDTILMLPRQHYKTYSAAVYYLWVTLYSAENYTMAISHKSATDAFANLKRIMDIVDEGGLPDYLVAHVGDKNDIDRQDQSTIAHTNNTIKTVSPPTSVQMADKAGRGMTVKLLRSLKYINCWKLLRA